MNFWLAVNYLQFSFQVYFSATAVYPISTLAEPLFSFCGLELCLWSRLWNCVAECGWRQQ